MIKRWATLAAAAVMLTACARAATTVILVRHAERPAGADPDLLPEGRARAESLAVALLRTPVDAIIHTQFKRTGQTAAPLAASKGVTPIVLTATGPEAQHAAEVVQRIDALAGKTVVYVGHSNTVPAVIQALGISPAPVIADTSYANFFIVTRGAKGPTMLRVRYGK
jgi:phosphohistidine phosphatase SixA